MSAGAKTPASAGVTCPCCKGAGWKDEGDPEIGSAPMDCSLCDAKGVVSRAVVCVNNWAGRQEFPIRVVGETPKRFRIAVDQPTPLPPRSLVLQPGETRLVPRTAVRFLPSA